MDGINFAEVGQLVNGSPVLASLVGSLVGSGVAAMAAVRREWRKEARAEARKVARAVMAEHLDTCPGRRPAYTNQGAE